MALPGNSLQYMRRVRVAASPPTKVVRRARRAREARVRVVLEALQVAVADVILAEDVDDVLAAQARDGRGLGHRVAVQRREVRVLVA